ncbi:SDR family oxidoreductase [Saccharopolyspora aridisoli]|uniref:SDR family oxidoreductase n=1 Tax=Saccharopolyspora aridisoli TaxID=2530385 RepID=A0A4R4V3D6_9PSEU|nr:SDR family NAD(P)-dependent oxidoreductase [Saccharopolyspora aridisoli]TDC96752.1 SDR family oxidoreductase [Saccharopolyspora aridisoli]
MDRLNGKRVLVTGGASGIGQASALRLLDEGARVLTTDIDDAGLEETSRRAAEAGTCERLGTLRLDISQEDDVDATVPAAAEQLGGLDVLVNAAGMLHSAHTHECSLELWNRVLAVNLTGTFLVTRAALPALLETGSGVVINFSSTSANFAHPYMAAYAASKGGIQSFTHSIALEYAKRGLRAVSLVPGGIRSGITETTADKLPTDTDWDLFTKLSPALGSGFAPPEHVAGVVAMLASDDGAFITGTEIRVDGGTHQ